MLDKLPPDSDIGYSSHPKPPGALPVSARSIGSFAQSPLPPTLLEWLNSPANTPPATSNRLAEHRGR
ncbi:ERMES complex subunit mmm1 [Puccinia graminis f. sp. tritici]|uniref:ERMES complex subunit mmm1 n=1 Tax=Puccinia graminis f. sp. tritici TaxID=56615 RepID=A0A5B0MBD3_PUCGR|nr:ERMES complex subunit mmm1 [Puccinia graminis f. sp. tritici]KAA1132880.1 ERMES complex subunit mmm1 [Puccinia graminis f. sp. tritici]